MGKELMKLNNPTPFCIIYRRQQTNSTTGPQTPLRGDRSYLPQDDRFPPAAKDMINYIGEQLDVAAETHRPNPSRFLMTKTGFQKLPRKLQGRILRH